MRIAYLDCFSGISGDMLLAALVDAGADRGRIEQELRKLPLGPFRMEWKTVVKKGVSALKLDVIDEELEKLASRKTLPVLGSGHGHHHHHEDSHDHGHHHHHEHSHDHGNHHQHDRDHGHDHHHHHDHSHDHSHHHRRYKEIAAMIDAADFHPRVTARAQAIFEKIAVAEAKIHNVPVETVHFHEVGALDSIVDVVGIALALEELQIDQIISGPVPTGNGYVRCDHGLYPVPAPATMEMLKGIPLRQTAIQKELTTPTGAGVAAGIVQSFGPLPAMTVDAIGYGAGTRDLPDQPNVLRVLVGTV
ncbi:LarC family nickel insertion protein [Brevibacillus composti]|uniref:LarC family nickel insertion protein n=1 Tax=Brevibacillus composti TaxID=2796470 RepID=A0A7T5JPH6_9BACL|nr:LarC family nickel insertion protein [Brevibacillus composti]QQE75269.1 LarC family nickel insertion protein [Brevibacillus composti]QUO42296.1 LarC family nickel insertion protein [Brevibacillus composti]